MPIFMNYAGIGGNCVFPPEYKNWIEVDYLYWQIGRVAPDATEADLFSPLCRLARALVVDRDESKVACSELTIGRRCDELTPKFAQASSRLKTFAATHPTTVKIHMILSTYDTAKHVQIGIHDAVICGHLITNDGTKPRESISFRFQRIVIRDTSVPGKDPEFPGDIFEYEFTSPEVKTGQGTR